ncbi:MAG: hypothetical protein NTY23_10455 [Chloroflexi bacterium]|nr:hypothetical protein [Chloroflexota bacterium]
MYIAHQGVVHDVTDCAKWRTGTHQRLHFPGQDLTSELPDAPRGTTVFAHPCGEAGGAADGVSTADGWPYRMRGRQHDGGRLPTRRLSRWRCTRC